MPELPEVEIVIRELRPLLVGKRIQAVEAIWPKTFVNRCAFYLTGQRIQAIERKGKYIIVPLDHSFLIIHLRMTGRLALDTDHRTRSEQAMNHVRFILHFADGTRLLFNDTRKFGRVYHVQNARQILDKVGIDGLDPNLTTDAFYQMLKGHKMGVKAFLMSQRFVSGLGNIYTDESLFRAKIHPEHSCASLSFKEAKRLFEAVRFILEQGIKNMGSTISDYRDAYGNPGKNQFYFKVYQREGQPCLECGTPIQKIRTAGRSTRFCPKCQM